MEVAISVSCRQTDEAGAVETVSYRAAGRFTRRGNLSFLSYEEPEASGLAGTRTTVVIGDGSVRILRAGAVSWRQEFIVGRVTESVSETAMGPLSIRMETRETDWDLTDGAGFLRMVYTAEVVGLFCHRNELCIEVREDRSIHGCEG